MTPDIDKITQFLDIAWPDAPRPGYLAVWGTPSKDTTWIAPDEPVGNVAALIVARANGENVYVGMGLHPQALDRGRRGESAGVSAIPGLWAEIDVGVDGHAESSRFSSVTEARAFVSATVPVEPTLVVASGHGLHCHWLFKEPWVLNSDGERAKAESLLVRLQTALIDAAGQMGVLIDSTYDLARVLRPAGTVNRKPNLPAVEVRIIEHAPDLRYNPSDLDDLLPDLPQKVQTIGAPRGGILPAELPTGTRHRAMIRFAGALRRWGLDAGEILGCLLVLNGRCQPACSEESLAQIAESALKYAPACPPSAVEPPAIQRRHPQTLLRLPGGRRVRIRGNSK